MASIGIIADDGSGLIAEYDSVHTADATLLVDGRQIRVPLGVLREMLAAAGGCPSLSEEVAGLIAEHHRAGIEGMLQ